MSSRLPRRRGWSVTSCGRLSSRWSHPAARPCMSRPGAGSGRAPA